MCDSASTAGAALLSVACSGPRHCCIRWGSTSSKGNGRFGESLFSVFTMGNAIASPTVKCFRFVCKNLKTFPFSKHIVGKLDSCAFWRYIQFQDKRWSLWEISKNVTIVVRNLRPTQQGCRCNMHIHEWMPRRSGAPPTVRIAFRLRMLATARSDAALSPNYFGQTCYYHYYVLTGSLSDLVRWRQLLLCLMYGLSDHAC